VGPALNHMKPNKIFLAFLISSLAFSSVNADPYSSAYGAQAQMSPASSTLSLGGNAQVTGAPSYMPGNGVYLSGQPAIAQQAAPIMAPINGGAANPYYAPQSPVAAPAYGQPYGAPMAAADPYAAYAGPNSYLTAKPAYGQPPHMVQRNSASYTTNNTFPYRNSPGVVLNPNSMTGLQNNQQNINPNVMNILGGNQPQAATASAQTVPLQSNNPNWFSKVFHRDASQPSKPSRW
jgi:hypothetical protein